MKKYIYWIIFVSIILIAVYQVIFMSFRHYIWGLGVLVFWIWVRKDITDIIGWIVDRKPVPKQIQQKNTVEMPDFETQKQSYLTLAKLCCGSQTKTDLLSFIENLEEHSFGENYDSILNDVIDHSIAHKICFIERLDWKQSPQELEHFLDETLKCNYDGLMIDFPGTSAVKTGTPLEEAFGIYNEYLQKQGLKIAFIDTQSDEFVFFVHKVTDTKEIIHLVNLLGYNYAAK